MSVAKVLPVNIMKTIQIFVVTFALLMVYAMMPTPTHAAGLTEVQMQAVINLLASFGAEQKTLDTVNLALRGGSKEDVMKALGNRATTSIERGEGQQGFPGASACGLLQRTLNRGNVGDDVRQLQDFLRSRGFLQATSSTNFFGQVTERALQAWQAHEGVVTNGDAQSTGFGAVGPKTRMMIMERCKDIVQNNPGHGTSTNNGGNQGENNDDHEGGTWGTVATTSPVCVLRANKRTVTAGQSVVLSWESRNATEASAIGGGRGPANGSLTLTPTETSTYLKRVYGPTGQGECMVTVVVGTTTPAAEKKVVMNFDIGRTIALMGSGMAAVMDGYLSLFGMSLE